ncbi:MAG: hypothetical protein IKD77_01695 [Bacilli bacterium]|nr:hypothetical protein [Bacilli bacterium]
MKKKKLKKTPIILLILLIIGGVAFAYYDNAQREMKKQRKIKEEKKIIKEIQASYSEYAKAKPNSKIYDKEKNIGIILNVPLKLKKRRNN